jgi:hypothetical protein
MHYKGKFVDTDPTIYFGFKVHVMSIVDISIKSIYILKQNICYAASWNEVNF